MSSSASQSRLKKYRKCKYLGKGSYGAAILVELKANNNQKFVVKEIVIGHLKNEEQDAAKKEAEVLHQMSHSNITMYVESFVEGSKLYIVMEHADGGDLSSHISNKRKSGVRWSEEEVMRMFVQICLALNHVHEKNILHRDLKSQNIFLTSKGLVKLGDFGIAKVLDATDGQAQTQIGTPYYLSPEICDSRPYGRKSDVWSLGCILFELITLELPFQANSLPALIVKICTGHPMWEKLESPTAITELTKSMLLKQPDGRPLVKDIVKSDYVKGHISRLLSHTLKMGDGGVPIQRQQSEPSSSTKSPPVTVPDRSRSEGSQDDVNKSSEEMELAIERERQKERHAEEKRIDEETRLKQQRAKDRETELSKLKQFKKEMMMVKKREEQAGENVVVVEGRDGAAALADMRARELERQGEQKEREKVMEREQERRQPKTLAEVRRERDSQSELEGLRKFKQDVLRRQKEESERKEQLQLQQQQQQIVKQDKPNYESIARQEYFKNREAARKIKEKVQALERQTDHYQSPKRDDRDKNAINNDDYEIIRRNRDSVGEKLLEQRQYDSGMEAMRARKDKEREVINEEYERKLQEAYQMNREAQKRLKHKIMQQEMDGEKNRQGAVAFDINFDDDGIKKSRGGGKPSSNAEIDSRERNFVQRQRKGWGPRNGDIKIVNNRMLRSESTNDHSSKEDNLDLQAPDMGVDKRLDKVDDVFRSSLASSSSVTPSMKHSREDLENVEDVKMDEDIVRNNFGKDDIATCTANDDGKENDENDLDDDVVSGHSVMQAVHDRQREKEDQKQQAKILLSQLKEQRIQKVRRGEAVVDIGSRLNDVLGSVDKAQAVVREMISKKVMSPAPKRLIDPKVAIEDNKTVSSDAKEDFNIDDVNGDKSMQQAEEKNTDGTDEAEAELERTLDGWLKRQEQNVTVRSRPKSAKDVEDVKYMSTMTMQESKQTMYSEAKDDVVDGMNDARNDGDGDISGLQCILANALLE